MNLREIFRKRKNKFKTFNLITIDSKRLRNNLEILQKIADLEIIPVLKSNAYGHGICEIARILEELKVKMIAVDSYFEARQIYQIFSGKILVLGVIDRENIKLLKGRRISYVLQDREDLHAFAKLHHKTNVHLELNTGMNRLGLKPDEIDDYLKTLKKYKNLQLEGVMTHLASADEAQNPTPEMQVAKFDEVAEKILAAEFKPKYFHIANSAGAGRVNSKFANIARAGISLYGINHLEESDKRFKEFEKFQPILELKSTIIKTVDLEKGDQVSYGGTFIAPEKMKIGILPLGYYEGISRDLSNRGIVSFEQQELPIVGRICMNHVMIDLSQTDLHEGNEVIVISREPTMRNSIHGISREFDVLENEILVRLNEHVRRRIV